MKIKLIDVGDGSALVWLTKEALEELGWDPTDHIIIDIPTTHNSLIIYRTED
jgi:hypothetical protein